MTTFIWDHDDVLKDYASGIVVVVADSEEDAVGMLKAALIEDCGGEKEDEAVALSELAAIIAVRPRVAETGNVTICRGSS